MPSRRRTKASASQSDRNGGAADPFRPVAPPSGTALAEREYRKDRVLEMYLKGWPVPMIAREVGIRVDAAMNAVEVVQREYIRRKNGNRAEQLAFVLAKIDQMERTYWDAWERSMKEAVRTSTSREDTPLPLPDGSKARADGEGKPPPTLIQTTTKVGRRVDYPVGNPAFLSGVQWCIDRRVKLLGLDKPERIDIRVHIRRIADELGVDPKYVEGQAYEVAKSWEENRELPSASGIPN